MRKTYLSLFVILICLFFLVSDVGASANSTIENYVKKGQFEKAEQYCEKQTEPKKTEYYRILAKSCLDNGYIDKAGEYNEKIDDKEGLNQVAYAYLANSDYTNAVKYYLAGGISEKETDQKVADDALAKENYDLAGEYYLKINDKEDLEKVADFYLTNNNYQNAINYYLASGLSEKETDQKVADDALAKENYDLAGEYYLKINDQEGLKKVALAYLKIENPKAFTGHTSSVNSVAVSTDRKYLISGSCDGTIKLWDLNNGQELRTFTGHTSVVNAVAISTDTKYLVSGSDDHTLICWDLASGKELHTFIGHLDAVYSVAISADNKYLASGSGDNLIKLWDLTSGQELRTYTGHSGKVNSLAISSDNKYLISGSDDGTIKIWNLAGGQELHTLSGTSHISSVAVTTDNKYLASGSDDQTTILWDLASGKKLRTYSSGQSDSVAINSVAISTDEKYLVSARGNTIHLWDLANGKELRILTGANFSSVALSTDNKYIVAGSDDNTINRFIFDKETIAMNYLIQAGCSNQDAVKTIGEYYFTSNNYVLAASWFNKAKNNEGFNKVIAALVDSIKNGTDDKRSQAVNDLTTIGPPAINAILDLLVDANANANAAGLEIAKTLELQKFPLTNAVYNLLTGDNADVRIQAVQTIENSGNKKLIPLLVRTLPDWWAGETIANTLTKLGWKAAVKEEKVHFWVALRDSESLKNSWAQTKQVLLNDVVTSNNLAIENALYAFIGIGKREIIKDLIDALNNYGNKTMAEAYLNCGSQELYDAGVQWANNNGYTIFQGPGAAPINWGTM